MLFDESLSVYVGLPWSSCKVRVHAGGWLSRLIDYVEGSLFPATFLVTFFLQISLSTLKIVERSLLRWLDIHLSEIRVGNMGSFFCWCSEEYFWWIDFVYIDLSGSLYAVRAYAGWEWVVWQIMFRGCAQEFRTDEVLVIFWQITENGFTLVVAFGFGVHDEARWGEERDSPCAAKCARAAVCPRRNTRNRRSRWRRCRSEAYDAEKFRKRLGKAAALCWSTSWLVTLFCLSMVVLWIPQVSFLPLFAPALCVNEIVEEDIVL